MKCPNCAHLAAEADLVCFSCKRYIGNVRQTEKIGGEVNYARMFPLLFVVAGTPMILLVYQKYAPGASRVSMYDPERIVLTVLLGLVLAAVGWVCGRLLGDGTTVRI